MTMQTTLAAALLAATVLAIGARQPALAVAVVPSPAMPFDSAAQTGEERYVHRLIAANELDKAQREVERLRQERPQSASLMNLEGIVHMARGDYARARRSFEQALAADPDLYGAALNLAQLDLRDHNPAAARARFDAMLKAKPDNVYAMIGLAGVANAVNDDAQYVSWLEKAAAAAPKMTHPRVLLARHWLEKQDAAKAVAQAQQAQAVAPEDPAVLDVLGAAQLAAGATADAVATYTHLTRVAPNDAAAHYKLASALVAAGNLGTASAELDRAVLIKPDYVDAKVLMATIALRAGRPGEALRVARDMQRNDPKSVAGLVLEGDALMAQRQYAAAVKAYESAFALRRNGIVAVKLHQARSAAGQRGAADAALVAWVREQPKDAAARVYLAEVYVREKRLADAAAQYEQVLAVYPRNARVLNDLAWVYQQQKDSRALPTAERAYALQPADPDVMDTLGWILVQQGATERGLKLLQTAADKLPDSATVGYHLAVALAKSGDKPRARRALEDVLAKHPSFRERAEGEALLKQL